MGRSQITRQKDDDGLQSAFQVAVVFLSHNSHQQEGFWIGGAEAGAEVDAEADVLEEDGVDDNLLQ